MEAHPPGSPATGPPNTAHTNGTDKHHEDHHDEHGHTKVRFGVYHLSACLDFIDWDGLTLTPSTLWSVRPCECADLIRMDSS